MVSFQLSEQFYTMYAFYAGVLVLKLLIMVPLTARHRFNKGIFMNPEDMSVGPPNSKVSFTDPDVERVRRAHLNDLESIPAFLVVSFLYLLTSPSPVFALFLLRAYTAARMVHTFVYAIKPMPQPARFVVFMVGLLITTYMALQVIMFFSS